MSKIRLKFNPFLLIPLRVHCWGGFGSQLFGCIVANRLAIRYPKRTIILVFHSSGVTYRSREIPVDLIKNFTVQNVDDYEGMSIELDHQIAQRLSLSMKALSVALAEKMGLLARLNFEDEYTCLKPWLLEVRGHYTQILLSTKEVTWLFSELGLRHSSQSLNKNSLKTALHFRLGDLQRLSMKSYISVKRLSEIVNLLSESHTLSIFSDSSESEVKGILNDDFSGKDVKVFHLPVLQVLQECVLSDCFIGTNSKITMWIAIFRQAFSLGEISAIPSEIFKQVQNLLPEEMKSAKLLSY